MNWLNRAEEKLGFLAVPGLPTFVVGFNALVFVLYKLNPEYLSFLNMDRELILQGQVWRLFTHLFIPNLHWIFPGFDWLGVVLYLMYISFLGNALERAMGAFRFTLYYLLSALGLAVAGFFFGTYFGNGLLNTSLLFAFVRYYPETVFYLAFVLPVRAVSLAWFSAAALLYQFVTRDLEFRASLVMALANYFLFFGTDLWREARHRAQTSGRREEFAKQVREAQAGSLHECAVCHRTEEGAPELEFRVGRDGQEYCREHLPKPGAV